MHTNFTKSQKGTSMVEVLIAMVIAAVGLLGFAGMQIRAMQELKIGYMRSIAINLASQMLESQKNNYRYARDGSSAFVLMPTAALPAMPSADCRTTACTPIKMDQYDKYQILTQLRAKLPESGIHLTWVDDPDPSGYYTLPGAGPTDPMDIDVPKHPVLGVTIIWREPEVSSSVIDPNCAFSASFATLAGYRCTYMSTNL